VNINSKNVYREGAKIVSQLNPVTSLNATARHFGISKNAVLECERRAIYKVAKRLRERLNPLIPKGGRA
jgi:hypothetical protein